MKRFLLYAETYPSQAPGSPRQTGIGNYCSDLARGLADLGHFIAVLTTADAHTAEPPAGTVPCVERAGREPRTPPELLRRAATLRRRIATHRPDVLLVGDPTAHQVAAVARLPRDTRYCPIFYGTELHGYTDRVAYRGWHPGRRVIRSVLASYIGRAYQPICISRYTAGLLANLGLPRRPECLVFPAVSQPFLARVVGATALDHPRARRTHGAAAPVRFITVARISERKNQLQVLQALAALRRREGLAFEYVIVGNVDSTAHGSYRESISTFTRENGLEDAVVLVENASDEEKIAWIDGSDVFVMLSRTVGHSVEGFGISVIEASCRGKAVVVSNQGGMPETIVEGQTGFAVPLESPEALERVLLLLARQPALRDTLGANGVQFVRGNFTPRRMAERLVAHLEGLGAAGGAEPASHAEAHG